MNIYSGECLQCECGINTPFKDIDGKELYTGDIVINYTIDKEGLLECIPDNLTAVVMNKYTTYADGKIELKDESAKPFIMGIASCEPVFIGPETQFKSDGNTWVVKKVKDYRDVISGEKWTAFGFNYK